MGDDLWMFDSTLDGSIDTITDFAPGFDLIELHSSIFESLSSITMQEWETNMCATIPTPAT